MLWVVLSRHYAVDQIMCHIQHCLRFIYILCASNKGVDVNSIIKVVTNLAQYILMNRTDSFRSFSEVTLKE